MSGWNPPPPPAGPPGRPGPYGRPGPSVPPMPAGPPSAAPRRKGRGCLVFGLLAGALALVLVAGVGGFAVYYMRTDHELSLPPRAAGMSLDDSAEAAKLFREVVPDARRVLLEALDPTDFTFDRGLYREGDLGFLVVGITGGYDGGDNLHGRLAHTFGRVMSTDDLKVTANIWEIDDAGGDGRAFCGRVTATAENASRTSYTSVCAWASRTTFVMVLPLGAKISGQDQREPPEYTVDGLQEIMRDLRADIET